MTTPRAHGVKPRKSQSKELTALRGRLQEADEMLRALKTGEVDALVRSGPAGEQVFTLKGAEHAYRVMVETMSEGAVTLAPDGLVLYCNRRFADFVKDDLERVLGSHMQRFIAPEDARKFDHLLHKAQRTEARNRIEIVRSDGTLIPTYIAMRMLVIDGIKSIIVVVTDLSELILAEAMRDQATAAMREQEVRFRHLAENIREVSFLVDIAVTRVLYVSPAYEAVWGASCESLYARPLSWTDSIHRDDRERVLAAFAQAKASGNFDFTFRIVRPDGDLRWIKARGFPIRDAGGSIYGIAGLAEDITLQRRLEEERAADALRLAQLSRRVVAVQEEERRRLAVELHDRTSPNLSAAALNLGMIAEDLPPQIK